MADDVGQKALPTIPIDGPPSLGPSLQEKATDRTTPAGSEPLQQPPEERRSSFIETVVP